MDGTPAYPLAHPHAHPVHAAANPAAVKTPSDYVRALRRRFWLVLTVGVPLSVLAAVYVLRQPPVYVAETTLSIVPPQSDPEFSTLVSRNGSRRDAEAHQRYFMDHVAGLRSKALAERVVNDPAFLQGSTPPGDEAVEDLLYNLKTQPRRNSTLVDVSLSGSDPARVAKQLSLLLELFRKQVKAEADLKMDNNKANLGESLSRLQNELKDVDRRLVEMIRTANFIGPNGTNVLQLHYENIGETLRAKRLQLSEAQKQAWVSQLFPKVEAHPEDHQRQDQIRQLQLTRHKLEQQLDQYHRVIRNYKGDPSVRYTEAKLQDVLEHLRELQDVPAREPTADPTEMIVSSLREEIAGVERQASSLLGQLKDSMPEHQKYLSLQEERQLTLKRIYDLQTNMSEYDMLSRTLEAPVTVLSPVVEPTKPARSQRGMKIGMGLMFSFGLGVALVCLLEHLDHSVKVPEHLTSGLFLPLLGVVPRIRRTSLVHRGGHLWTPGDPLSVEADAYRNLRASLLGAADRLGPINALLITSAKAGEGKSTTALNLAATCARAGERTLLMDIDLRRPSLRGVFEDGESDLGLVDVLRGELPWQRTLVRTDIPNLDFLPTGDTNRVPIEILGTLELRQLMAALTGHYDRVILDGPAVLGLADCRMLGRVVDAALLVVRAGSHEMRPLQRAKAMLEQSHVVIAGAVFNGLDDDLDNWSSYGPTAYAVGGPAPRGGLGAAVEPALGLVGPHA